MPADLFHGLLVSMGQLCKAFPSLWDQGIRFLLANIGCCQGRLSALDSVLLGGNINMGWHHRFHGHGDAC